MRRHTALQSAVSADSDAERSERSGSDASLEQLSLPATASLRSGHASAGDSPSSTPSAGVVDDTGLSLSASPSYVNLVQLHSDKAFMSKLHAAEVISRSRAGTQTGPALQPAGVPALFEVALPVLRQGYTAMVDDSFTRCFKSQKRVPWNWNCYLFPVWVAGLVLRYVVLFPLRLLCLVMGFVMVAVLFPLVKLVSLLRIDTSAWETWLIQMLASAFVASWSGVIRIHGVRPKPRAGQPTGVFVANHSSMIDFIILLQSHPYAVVGQKHPGWVGFLQDHLLRSLHCVWFDRAEVDNRKVVAERLKEHAGSPTKANFPLLVFPEGTCVNNEYVVQFRKGVFEYGVPINPIAIKYNKVFVDGYWHSREQSFAQHLFRLMTSWAVVADIWFMDPQTIRLGESPAEFATRVQRMIAGRAGLKAVAWDGYMKYWRPSQRFIEERQHHVAEALCSSLRMPAPAPRPASKEDGDGGEGRPPRLKKVKATAASAGQ